MEAARTGISTAQVVAYVALAAGLSATGNLIIKNAARSMGGLNLSGGHLAQTLFHLFTNPGIILGLALYLVGFVLWAKVLSTVDISLAYPIFVSLAFVIVVLGSRIFFGESLMGRCRRADLAHVSRAHGLLKRLLWPDQRSLIV